jgi:hypothetical protein
MLLHPPRAFATAIFLTVNHRLRPPAFRAPISQGLPPAPTDGMVSPARYPTCCADIVIAQMSHICTGVLRKPALSLAGLPDSSTFEDARDDWRPRRVCHESQAAVKLKNSLVTAWSAHFPDWQVFLVILIVRAWTSNTCMHRRSSDCGPWTRTCGMAEGRRYGWSAEGGKRGMDTVSCSTLAGSLLALCPCSRFDWSRHLLFPPLVLIVLQARCGRGTAGRVHAVPAIDEDNWELQMRVLPASLHHSFFYLRPLGRRHAEGGLG